MPTTLPKKQKLLGDDHPEWDKSGEKTWFPNHTGAIAWILIAVVVALIGGLLLFVALVH